MKKNINKEELIQDIKSRFAEANIYQTPAMEEYTKIILEELVNAIQKEIRLDIINNNRNKLWDL